MAQSVFILESGRVAVLKHWKNQDYLLRYLEPGACFGEMALMDMYPRGATAMAVADSAAFKIGSPALLELYRIDMEQFTLLQMNMGREVSRRLREATDKLFRLSVTVDSDDKKGLLPEFSRWDGLE